MSIPKPLRAALHDPAFWARYTFAADDGPGADRLGALKDRIHEEDDEHDEHDDGSADDAIVVTFDVGRRHRLVLDLDVWVRSYELGILGRGQDEQANLGWDDLGHWHPYALRWAELDLICRAVAARDPRLPHPGVPLALLCRFAAVFDDDDVDRAAATVDAAYAALRPADWQGYWPCAADWLARADFRGHPVVWHRDPDGHLRADPGDDHHTDREFYSLRVTTPSGDDSDEGDDGEVFPHAELQALLLAAATTVEAAGGS